MEHNKGHNQQVVDSGQEHSLVEFWDTWWETETIMEVMAIADLTQLITGHPQGGEVGLGVEDHHIPQDLEVEEVQCLEEEEEEGVAAVVLVQRQGLEVQGEDKPDVVEMSEI